MSSERDGQRPSAKRTGSTDDLEALMSQRQGEMDKLAELQRTLEAPSPAICATAVDEWHLLQAWYVVETLKHKPSYREVMQRQNLQMTPRLAVLGRALQDHIWRAVTAIQACRREIARIDERIQALTDDADLDAMDLHPQHPAWRLSAVDGGVLAERFPSRSRLDVEATRQTLDALPAIVAQQLASRCAGLLHEFGEAPNDFMTLLRRYRTWLIGKLGDEHIADEWLGYHEASREGDDDDFYLKRRRAKYLAGLTTFFGEIYDPAEDGPEIEEIVRTLARETCFESGDPILNLFEDSRKDPSWAEGVLEVIRITQGRLNLRCEAEEEDAGTA